VSTRAVRARYLPIAEHGLIGDLHTVALVGSDGTIDWYCCGSTHRACSGPSSTPTAGACSASRPTATAGTPSSSTSPTPTSLITRFLTPDGVGEVHDFMPPPPTGDAAHRHRMIRRILAVRGQMRFVVDVGPRVNYVRARHEVALTPHGALFHAPDLTLSLATRCPLEIVDGRDVRARIAVRAGQVATLVLGRVEPGRCRRRTPMRTSPPSSTPPWRFGGTGRAARATTAGGAKWRIAPRSPSSCARTHPPGRSWPHPPPACRSSSAAEGREPARTAPASAR
jgi:hypothetical protein